VDSTIADFVADRRAPTPSAAAEILSPSMDDVIARLDSLRERLHGEADALLRLAAGELDALRHRLQRSSPRFRLEVGAQRLDELKARLDAAARRAVADAGAALGAAASHLNSLSPLAILGRGYAAAFDAQGALLRGAAQAKVGGALRLLLGQGELDATITAVHKERRNG
jgi:exodeoxyribonuclease VII large subunit